MTIDLAYLLFIKLRKCSRIFKNVSEVLVDFDKFLIKFRRFIGTDDIMCGVMSSNNLVFNSTVNMDNLWMISSFSVLFLEPIFGSY